MLVKNMESEKSYWRRWYISVLLFLVVQIGVFYFITKYFN